MQHRYSTRFVAMLQDKLHVFCCPFFRTLRESKTVLDSGLHTVDSGRFQFLTLELGFRIPIVSGMMWIPWMGFRIPKPRIPDSTSKNFQDSGIRIPLHGAKLLMVTVVFLVTGRFAYESFRQRRMSFR